MTALTKRAFTQQEYLALECRAEYKSQYVAGEIFAMAGAEPAHVEITDNITAALRAVFRGWPCRSYSTDLRVRISPGELITYPDVVALCGEPDFDRSSDPPSLRNPQVIFEVLSRSTEAFDRGDKFARYRTLETLTDYVLVSSQQMRVEHYILQANHQWLLSENSASDDQVKLASLKCELPLADIYERVTFPSAIADK